MLEGLKKKIIVSVQAMPNEPFYDEVCINAMMQDVINGGASALRVAGVRDVKNAKKMFQVPVIGLTKPKELPLNWKSIVYITPTLTDVKDLIVAGADIIAFDGTSRHRPDDSNLSDIVNLIHAYNRIAMADISTFEEGFNCASLGVDIISTTLAGYTQESLDESSTPNFKLLEKLVKNIEKPVFLEGRVWTPEEVKKAFEIGAHAVVIGSAITRPHLITKRFIEGSI